jgi:hypothetical protein
MLMQVMFVLLPLHRRSHVESLATNNDDCGPAEECQVSLHLPYLHLSEPHMKASSFRNCVRIHLLNPSGAVEGSIVHHKHRVELRPPAAMLEQLLN